MALARSRFFPFASIVPAAFVLVLAASPILAEGTGISPWTPDDLVEAEDLGAVVVADDGSRAAWVKTEVVSRDGKKTRVGRLWSARLDGESAEPRQLTHGPERIGQIAFSPDGARIAFVSDRPVPDAEDDDKASQLWVLPLDGGEARVLTSGSRGVGPFAWIDDASLLFAREEEASLREQELEDGKDQATAVDDPRDSPYVRLFRVDLEGNTRRLGLELDWVSELAVAPGGRPSGGNVAVISAQQSTRYAFDAKIPPQTFLVDLSHGERRRILADAPLLPRSFRWTPDGRGFYFLDDYTSHPVYRQATVARLHFYDLEADSSREIAHGWERGIGQGYTAVPGGVVSLLADGTRYLPARIGDDGRRTELDGPEAHRHHLDQLEVAKNGSRIVYVSSTGDRPPQLFAAALGDEGWSSPVQLGELNPSFARRPSGRTEIVRFEGALGDTVEGVLHYPYGWEEGKKYPLILDIHGGPTGYDRHSWDASWSGPTPLWRQRGAFVLKVNYHGSGNYGLDWAESIRERYYELEIPDLEAGVDALIDRGLVDPDRLATTGWSNGGILSAGLIVHTDRYKAAIVGAADVEWISDWGNVDFGAAFDNYYFGGPPWERLDHYIEKSPFFEVEKITTPTLLHTGTEDRNVPPHQSWSFFRAIQFLETADVRLVLYPGEPHGLRQVAHQRRKIVEDLEWLDRHLFGVEPTLDLPAGSLLAARAARRDAARSDDPLGGERWGVEKNGKLVPETVLVRGLHVGRFEVTVDQWRAFEPSFRPDLDGRLPAAGMGFERAQAYVAWLSDLTGETYRLPTAQEAGSWTSDNAKGSGNGNGTPGITLDRWVGDTPNVDDRSQLLQAADAAGVSLLEPVGSAGGRVFAGTGGEGSTVFDLDGNAAEWATQEEGSGKALGASADRPAGSSLEPGADFVGLRVVREP